MSRVNIGVVGCGYWGPNLVRNFVEIPSSDVVAVADLRPDRLAHIQARYPQIRTSQDYRVLMDLGLDAVVVATPPATHYRLAKEFLESDLHVLVEKPVTLNSQHAQELLDLAEARRLVLMAGHTFEFNPAVRALRDVIRSGELGEIYYVDTARLSLGLFQKDINVLWDLAPHDISTLLYILDRTPICVRAQGRACVMGGLQDVVYLNLMFPDNIMVHVHLSWLDPCKVRRITVVGSKKMAVYNDVEALEKIKIYDRGVEQPPYTDTFGDFQCSYRYGDVVIPHIRFVEPLRLECQHFVDCILNGQAPQSNGRAGLRVIQVLEAADRSLKNGGAQEVICLEEEANGRTVG
jgi:predicted dehydrogenase